MGKNAEKIAKLQAELDKLVQLRESERETVLARYDREDYDALIYHAEYPDEELTAAQKQLKAELDEITQKYSRIFYLDNEINWLWIEDEGGMQAVIDKMCGWSK